MVFENLHLDAGVVALALVFVLQKSLLFGQDLNGILDRFSQGGVGIVPIFLQHRGGKRRQGLGVHVRRAVFGFLDGRNDVDLTKNFGDEPPIGRGRAVTYGWCLNGEL